MSKKNFVGIAVVCVWALGFTARAGAQDKPKDAKGSAAPAAEFKIPPEEAKKTNPLKSDAATIADGKKLFGSQCYFCHGKDGDGKGDMAGDMKVPMKDYHDAAALKGVTDGEMFYILSQGKGEMPSEGDRLSVNQRWQLITYIRSLAGKPMAAAAKDEKKTQ